MIQRIGEVVYKFNLSEGHSRQALWGIYDIFHISLQRPHHDNGLGTDLPPIEVDGEVKFEVEKILKSGAQEHQSRNLVLGHLEMVRPI